ncbi:MAG TPA: amidase family protein [Microthrixaceae bacterium]|nr:amidase family protein [Microthrixaceae bacterium]
MAADQIDGHSFSPFDGAGVWAKAVRSGKVSSRELLECCLERVERHNPALNAVVVVDVERARTAADAADRAVAAGDALGPLHGVPMTVKDVFETEALVTTSGAPELADHVPSTDAVTVARLRAAGAVIFGKTNTPLYAGDLVTDNEVYGRTNNPWDLDHTPGGSSGGSAAAVAAGLTPLELGSDIGGSIRSPSGWCGVVGLKPSWGAVPSRGHIPGPPGSLLEVDVNVCGPIARSTGDLRLAFDVLAGPLPDDAVGWRLDLPRPRPRDGVRALRVTIVDDDEFAPVSSEVRAVIGRAADRLADAGAIVEAAPLPVPMPEAVRTWATLVLSIIGTGLPDDGYREMTKLEAIPAGDDLAVHSAQALTARVRDRMRADQLRQVHRQLWAAHFAEHDLVITPTMPVPAPLHQSGDPASRVYEVDGTQRPQLDLISWAGAIGISLQPVVSVPVGFTDHPLPVGVQLIGPFLHDLDLLDMAGHVMDVTGDLRIPPGYEA